MKYIIDGFIFLLLIYSFTPFNQKRYLPVTIHFFDSVGVNDKQIKLGLITAFKTHKIQVLSNQEMTLLIKDAAANTAKKFHESGGALGDFNKFKAYSANNMHPVGTSIDLKLKITSEGILNDTILWTTRVVPVKFDNTQKNSWKVVILDSLRSVNAFEIANQVVEKIIASGELAKE